MVPDVALGVGSAVARVDTVTVVASLSLRAVVICLTTDHNNSRFWSWQTLDIRITGCVGGTETVSKLVIRLADCCGGAGVVGETGVSTEGENTGVVVQAVAVEFASSRWSWTINRVTI